MRSGFRFCQLPGVCLVPGRQPRNGVTKKVLMKKVLTLKIGLVILIGQRNHSSGQSL